MLKIFRQYYPVRNILFVIGEGAGIFYSVLLTSFILLESKIVFAGFWLYFKAFLIASVCQICLYYNDLYDLKITNSYSELGVRLLQALGFASIFLAGIYFIFSGAIIREGVFIISVGFVILFVISWRFCYTLVLNSGLFNEKIIIVGAGELAGKIVDEIIDKRDCGYAVSARVVKSDGDIDPSAVKDKGIMFKSGYHDLSDISMELKVNKIVVAIKQKRGAFPIKELLRCRVNGIDIIKGNDFYELLTGKLVVDQINPAWLIYSEGFKRTRIKRVFKRSIDIILALILLILMSPVTIITAFLIKIDSKGPVVFSQERVGEKGKTFRVHKFRSMIADAEKVSGPVWSTEEDDRITRVGNIIRKLRIDEIPQLWNVLKGEMSFVGPRPEREFFVKQLDEQIPYYSERHTVKPGITGWAQVSYGYGASVEDAVEKLNYDLFYTKNFSIFMDFMIVLRTIKIVVFGKGR